LVHHLPKLKFIIWLKSTIVALFASAGLVFGILGIVIFAAFVSGAVVLFARAVSMLLSLIFKGRSVMSFIVGMDDRLLRYASVKLQKEMVLKNPAKLAYSSDSVQKEIIQKDSINLKYASAKLQKEFVAKAPIELQHASGSVQRELVSADPVKLVFASEALQRDLVALDPKKLAFSSEALQRELVSAEPEKLQYASVVIKNDPNTLLDSQYAVALKFASFDVQKEIALKDVQYLSYVSDEVQIDIVEADIKKLKHASRKLQQRLVRKDCTKRKHAVYMHEFSLDQIQEKSISRKYKNIKVKDGAVTLSITGQEISQDILLDLLSIPQIGKPVESSAAALLEYYEDKLNIIYADMTEENVLRGLVRSMVDAIELYPKNHAAKVIQKLVRSSFVRRGKIKSYQAAKVIQEFARSKIKNVVAPELSDTLVAAAKFDFCIDKDSLPQVCLPDRRLLSDISLPLKDMSEFMMDQLRVIIYKNKMPSMGGLADFRAKFIACLLTPQSLRYNEVGLILQYHQGEMSTSEKKWYLYNNYCRRYRDNIAPFLFEYIEYEKLGQQNDSVCLSYREFVDKKLEQLSKKVKGLDDEDFMFLFGHLRTSTLVSLRDAILSSNNQEIADCLHARKGLQASP
tara:strand:+ start:1425 stop:3305 length:1881 start_codon:yes stop_codon:yes gene_type:complete